MRRPMGAELPIACSLDAARLSRRLSDMASVGRDGSVRVRLDGTRAELRLARRAGLRERLDAIVAAERECCPFLTMRVSATGGALVLAIEAPEGAEAILAELVEAFAA